MEEVVIRCEIDDTELVSCLEEIEQITSSKSNFSDRQKAEILSLDNPDLFNSFCDITDTPSHIAENEQHVLYNFRPSQRLLNLLADLKEAA
ncbi:hypothetical protein [Flexibacterium corallicola]|uniref:hypothetical protein n=1 Tax=Flexibacterium corallicola TaxID=3037259 RepID=UPI00286FA6AD|nr:hypothetical protein [Pseudovibrio sp. M1P-2-3]